MSLKSLLGKRSEASAWLELWKKEQQSSFCIEDDKQQIIFGELPQHFHETFPLEVNDEIIGCIKGEAKISLLVPALVLLLKKEAERKKLGTEVLHLYQELNVIYNFSEKLTETIDPDTIANLTLEQAMHSIPSH